MPKFKKHRAISDEKNVAKIERKSKKNMLIGTILGYVAILISIANGLILTPRVIAYVGEVDYGSYGIVTSLIALFLLDFGLSTTTNIYLSKLRAEGDKEGVERFLSSIFKIYLLLDIIFALVIAILYFACPYMYASSIDSEHIGALQNMLLIFGGLALVNFPSTTFTGVISTYEKFSINKLMDIIQKSLYLGFTIVAINMNWGIIGISIVNVSSIFLTIVFKFLYMRFYLNIRLNLAKRIDRHELKSVLSFSMWSLILAIAARLVFNITPSILGIVSDAAATARMTVVITIEGYIYSFGTLISSFFLAKIARSEANKSDEEKARFLQSLSSRIGKIQLTIIGVIMTGFVCAGQEFIDIWMGPEFGIVYWCIVIICSYNVLYVPEIVFESAMLTEGHIKPLAINAAIKAIINVSLSFPLSYFFTHNGISGALGASIAIMAARFAELVLNNIAYKRYLHISLTSYFKDTYLRGGLTILIALAVGLSAHFLLPYTVDYVPFLADERIRFLIIGFSVVIVFSICTLFITFPKEERSYFLASIARVLHIKRKNHPEDIAEEKEEQKLDEMIYAEENGLEDSSLENNNAEDNVVESKNNDEQN